MRIVHWAAGPAVLLSAGLCVAAESRAAPVAPAGLSRAALAKSPFLDRTATGRLSTALDAPAADSG